MTISVLLDIFYVPNFGCFGKKGVFQQPLPITLTAPDKGFERYRLLLSHQEIQLT